MCFLGFPLPPLPIRGGRGFSSIVSPLNVLFNVGQAYGGVPPIWVWVVGVSPQILERPTSIYDTGVNGQKSKKKKHLMSGKRVLD